MEFRLTQPPTYISIVLSFGRKNTVAHRQTRVNHTRLDAFRVAVEQNVQVLNATIRKHSKKWLFSLHSRETTAMTYEDNEILSLIRKRCPGPSR